MKNYKILILAIFVLLFEFFVAQTVRADFVIDHGLNFLKSKQDATGRINTGFSAPSQWSAIAFAANGVDISNVKNTSISLQDFLTADIPSEPSSATDWETRILAIVATNGDPTNYGGVNYISHLESFYNSNQIGDSCSLNDDIFGLLAEISAGSSSSAQIKQSDLDYLITKQDPTDGGFGYSAPGCSYYSTSADMTGAAVQALVAAKNNGLITSDLDQAISRAKNYLLVNQDSDGGYGYYRSSDTDTSGWVLMAFNVLDMQDSTQSANLKNWLISKQSSNDGGFLAYDYGSSSYISNSTTTAQALIGLVGKSWILKIFDPSTITPTPTAIPIQPTPTNSTNSNNLIDLTPTNIPSPTPTATTANSSTDSLTQTPTSSPTQTPAPTPINSTNSTNLTNLPAEASAKAGSTNSTIAPGQILGSQTSKLNKVNQPVNKSFSVITIVFFGLSLFFAIIHFVSLHI